MGNITDAFAGAFRDYVTEGVPASGENEPVKSEIRAIGPLIESALSNIGLGALVDTIYATKAALDADLAHPANSVGLVYADATDANNDLYVKSGASGSGSWANTGALHSIIEGLAQPYVDAAEAAAAAATGPLKASASYSLFPDRFFRLSGNNRAYADQGGSIYRPAQNNGSWDSLVEHRYGRGAWKHTASGDLQGYDIHFANAPATEAGIGPGDVISLAMMVKGTSAGQKIRVAYRFFSGSISNYITGQTEFPDPAGGATGDGTEQVLKAENITIPATATGVNIYTWATTPIAEYHVVDLWAVRGPFAGDTPPWRLSNSVSDRMAAAGETFASMKAKTDWSMTLQTTVSYSALAVSAASSVTGTTPRDLTFSGHGQAWAKPSTISFNAVRLKSVVRSSAATALWSYLKVVVRTHATNAAGTGATVLAVGTARVNPALNPVPQADVLLRDPTTGAVKTITDADLLADFFIGVYAETESGSDAAMGETTGVVAGLSPRQSYYLTSGDGVNGAWAANSGNPSLTFELMQLTNPTETTVPTATAALRTDLGLGQSGSAPFTNPAATEPIMPPRLYGVVGREMNAYLTELHSSVAKYAYNVDAAGASAFGRLLSDCWRHKPTVPASNVQVTFQVLDPEQLNVLGSKTVRADVVVASGPSGATRRVCCIGDSTTNAGIYTQRLLDVAASNASGVQVTLVGTRGSGANKHEGRGGWTVGRYFQPTGDDIAQNPFISTPGSKFDASYYLSSTGQAAPDIVFWHLGINDVFGQTSDSAVNSIMDTAIDQLNRMIGVTVDATVGSWKEANANVKTLIALPIPPAGSADAFGDDYDVGQTLERYKRNIKIVAYRLAEAYKNSEAANIFLVPWHVAIDPAAGWAVTVEPANQSVEFTTVASYSAQVASLSPSDGALFYCTDAGVYIVKVGASGTGAYREAGAADGIVARQNNGVHPNTRGYNQMGDGLSDAINALVSLGLA